MPKTVLDSAFCWSVRFYGRELAGTQGAWYDNLDNFPGTGQDITVEIFYLYDTPCVSVTMRVFD